MTIARRMYLQMTVHEERILELGLSYGSWPTRVEKIVITLHSAINIRRQIILRHCCIDMLSSEEMVMSSHSVKNDVTMYHHAFTF